MAMAEASFWPWR